MQKISADKINKVLSVIGKPIEVQQDIFDKLGLDPYAVSEDAILNSKYLLSKDEVEEAISNYCNDLAFYTDFKPNRILEIEQGSDLTSIERDKLKKLVCQHLAEEKQPWLIFEIKDETRSVYIACIMYFMGQGGIDFGSFFGFFKTKKDALNSLNSLEGIIIN